MTKNMKISAAIFGVVVILYFISQSGQKKHHTQSNNVFSIVMEEVRSEERRVGKECRSRWSPYH